MYVRVCVRAWAQVLVYTCVRTFMCVCTRKNVRARVRVRACVWTRAHVLVCVCDSSITSGNIPEYTHRHISLQTDLHTRLTKVLESFVQKKLHVGSRRALTRMADYSVRIGLIKKIKKDSLPTGHHR